MNWDEIWKIVLGILTSFGGISGIIIIAIKFSCNNIANNLQQKYTLKLTKDLEYYKTELGKEFEEYKSSLDKELEKYKSTLNNKTYISKTKFDTEFSIYKELSKVFSDMVKNINLMIPIGMSDKLADEDAEKEHQNRLYSRALSSTVIAQDTLNQYIPFIPNNIFDDYNTILELCRLQIDTFERRWDKGSLVPQKERENFSREDYNRTKEINEKFNILNNNIRRYLSKLDVLH